MAVRRGLSDDQPVHDLHPSFLLAAVFLFDCEVFIMCEVKRYKAMVNTPDGVIVADVYLSEDFDRVQAENVALQARLTAQDQRVDELEGPLQGWLDLFPKQGVAGGPITTMKERTISALNPSAEAASHE